ncbi:hypothetical protein CALCODRAFT_197224 [Calocera cornea HHB12733]|uniref:Uncharacterized protein n=1 Tax=Calocera cornea HHB12733 TaxID=1353952 RepID=A0A165C5W3_9BASI|nr:hypothetical protein CALCODRAFT_197224 [Calocera cornea HHB12733]
MLEHDHHQRPSTVGDSTRLNCRLLLDQDENLRMGSKNPMDRLALAPTHSMEQTWRIPELLGMICDRMTPDTLRSVALTHKYASGIAERSLWARIRRKGLGALIALADPSGHYSSSTALQRRRRKRFDELSACVREIELEPTSEDSEMLWMDDLRLLAGRNSAVPLRPLFPNLSRLSVVAQFIVDLELTKLLGHATLERLQLLVDSIGSDEDTDNEGEGNAPLLRHVVLALLRWVGKSLPSLTSLRLDIPHFETAVLRTNGDFLHPSRTNSLVEFIAFGNFLSPSCVGRLCNAPLLEKLVIIRHPVSDQATDERQTVSIVPPLPLSWPSFGRLTYLGLDQVTQDTILFLRRVTGPLETVRLYFTQGEYLTGADLSAVAGALSAFSDTLSTVRLAFLPAQDSPAQKAPGWWNLKALSRCKNMQCLSVRVGAPCGDMCSSFRLEDADLIQMGQAWGNLESLAIVWTRWRHGSFHPSIASTHCGATVHGLVELLRHCPQLATICLSSLSLQSEATPRGTLLEVGKPVVQKAHVFLYSLECPTAETLEHVGAWLGQTAPQAEFHSRLPQSHSNAEKAKRRAATELEGQLRHLNLVIWRAVRTANALCDHDETAETCARDPLSAGLCITEKPGAQDGRVTLSTTSFKSSPDLSLLNQCTTAKLDDSGEGIVHRLSSTPPLPYERGERPPPHPCASLPDYEELADLGPDPSVYPFTGRPL